MTFLNCTVGPGFGLNIPDSTLMMEVMDQLVLLPGDCIKSQKAFLSVYVFDFCQSIVR